MKRRASVTAVAAIVAGIGISLVVPAVSAVGLSSPPTPVIKIGDRVTLIARGAALSVPVRVTVNCEPGVQPTLQVGVSQVVGNNKVAHAFGGTDDIVCDGAPHAVQVNAVSNDLQFHTGPAFVEAFLYSCGPFIIDNCRTTDARRVRVVRG